MANTPVNDVLTRLGTILTDDTHVRWPKAELLHWMTDAQREIVNHRPEAYAINVPVATAANSKQDLVALVGSNPPPHSLIRVGSTIGGKAIRIVSREVMDAQTPSWRTVVTTGEILHYMYDPLNPLTFYIYPAIGGVNIELIYAGVPGTLSEGIALTLSDMYVAPIVDYVCYRAYSKDAEYAQNGQLAAAHYTQFANFLGLFNKTTAERNPNFLEGGFNPAVPKRA